jgi:DNA-binding response OmpR family regulator
MDGMRALVVEDDESIAKLNKYLLGLEGFDVDVAATAGEGGRLAGDNDYALIILDMILPDGHGMAVLEKIRAKSRATPILIVSGMGDIATTVGALDAGADDYLHKPYEVDELRARVRALLRRGQLVESPVIECGNVALHRMERYATVGDAQLSLTAKEFALLEYFVINRGQTLSRKKLLEKVWRFDFDPGTNMVDVNVARLRAKLVELGATCRLDAARGVGYVFCDLPGARANARLGTKGARV